MSDKPEENLKTSFRGENGREYQVRITIPIAHKICREMNLNMEGLNPINMNVAQLLDIAYLGSRNSARIKVHGESKEEFLEALDGPSFTEAQLCAMNALVLFSLRVFPSESQELIRESLREAQVEDENESQEGPGPGEKSSEPAEQSESIPSPQNAPLEK